MPERTGVPTTDKLRREIDRGLAADKVKFSDPAAAPLGTDDEAAGKPANEAERRIAAEPLARGEDRRGVYPMPFLLMMIVVIVAVALAAYWAVAGR